MVAFWLPMLDPIDISEIETVDIDAYFDAGWKHVYQGVPTDDAWVNYDLGTNQIKTITAVRIRLYNKDAAEQRADIQEIRLKCDSRTLTGNFGTDYGLFEGKLLSDGSPALYFHGTKGLYSIDIDAN